MIINKITTGFVTQQWDTQKKQFIGQTFTPGDSVQYEDENGETVPFGFLGTGETEPYLPFDMVQPHGSEASGEET